MSSTKTLLRQLRSARPFGFVFLATLTVVACGTPAEETGPEAVAEEPVAAAQPVALDPSVLDDPSRPEEERAQDIDRKPIEVFEFFEVQPGETVADVFNGDGYNTHLLSRLVGGEGKVFSVFEFYGDKDVFDGQLYKVDTVSERVDTAGLSNVELVMHLTEIPADSVDTAIAVRNYHDVEWVFPDLTRAEVTAEFFRMVKPGGIVGIVEVATPNEGWDQPTHRLNMQVTIDDFVAAGFEFIATSDLLANPDDDHMADGFPERHKTDRYVVKFRKPGN